LAILGFTTAPTSFWGWIPIVLRAPLRVGANQTTKILVLELAADKPGDIKYLTSFIKPDIAVITAIGPSHLAAFGELAKIVEEKTSLLWALKSDGWAVLNLDDENVRKASYGGRWQKMTYGINQSADLVAEKIETKLEGASGLTNFHIKGRLDLAINLKTLGGTANVYAALAAAAVGKVLDLSSSAIKTGLERVQPEKHRMNILKGKKGSIIIDDCYNANPLSMSAALKTLSCLKTPAAGRKIAVLGDMRELGKISDQAHELVSQMARQTADQTIAVGSLAKRYQADQYFKDVQAAQTFLLKEVRSGDILLIKASRALGLERIVNALKE